jgi:hypothetical protein
MEMFLNQLNSEIEGNSNELDESGFLPCDFFMSLSPEGKDNEKEDNKEY